LGSKVTFYACRRNSREGHSKCHTHVKRVVLFPVALVIGVPVPFPFLGIRVYFVFSRLYIFSEKDMFLFGVGLQCKMFPPT
jgi:hypothetical protein